MTRPFPLIVAAATGLAGAGRARPRRLRRQRRRHRHRHRHRPGRRVQPRQTWASTTTPKCSGTVGTFTWANALAEADAANAATHRGFKDLRLPNRTELESLIDITQSNTATSAGFSDAFPATPAAYYWSSTTMCLDTANAGNVGFRRRRRLRLHQAQHLPGSPCAKRAQPPLLMRPAWGALTVAVTERFGQRRRHARARQRRHQQLHQRRRRGVFGPIDHNATTPASAQAPHRHRARRPGAHRAARAAARPPPARSRWIRCAA